MKNALVVWMGIIFLAELVTPVQVLPHATRLITCLTMQAQLAPLSCY